MAKHARPSWWQRAIEKLKNRHTAGVVLLAVFITLFIVSYNYFMYQQGFKLVEHSELTEPGSAAPTGKAGVDSTTPGGGMKRQNSSASVDQNPESTESRNDTQIPTELPSEEPAHAAEREEPADSPEPDAATVLASLSLPLEDEVVREVGWYFSEVLQEWRYHPGWDLGAEPKEPVRAAFSGTVKYVEYLEGFGATVTIAHPAAIETVYGGLGRVDVRPGDDVAVGQVIGLVGPPPMGEDDTTHVHFELHVSGKPVDPAPYLGK